MTDVSPKRLADAADLPPAVRRVLRSAAEDEDPQAVARLEARLAPMLWPTAAPPAAPDLGPSSAATQAPDAGGAGAASAGAGAGAGVKGSAVAAAKGGTAAAVRAAGGAALVKPAVIGLALIGAASASWLLSTSRDSGERRLSDSGEKQRSKPDPSRTTPGQSSGQPTETPQQLPASAPQPPPAPQPTARRPTPRVGPHRRPTRRRVTLPAIAPDVLNDEVRLIDHARQLIASNPRRALDTLNAHRRRYPGGALQQERLVLAAEVYCKLGKTTSARRVTRRFRRRYPRSAYLQRLKQVLAACKAADVRKQ